MNPCASSTQRFHKIVPEGSRLSVISVNYKDKKIISFQTLHHGTVIKVAWISLRTSSEETKLNPIIALTVNSAVCRLTKLMYA